MISLLEVAERARKGPKMAEMDWNMGLFAKVGELVERFQIQVPMEDSWDYFFNEDDALSQRALDAGMAFLAESGCYCLQTERVLSFSMAELRQAVSEIPQQVLVGEGDDRRSFGVGPSLVPKGIGTGALHGPFEDEIALDVARTFVECLQIDYIQSYNFRQLDGREIHGVPMEAAAAKRALSRMREAVRQAGRPGMCIFYYPISTADAVLTAPIDPDKGLRPTDGVLLSTLPDVKLDLDMLTAAIVYEDYGPAALNTGGGTPVGGFCGGIAGAIVETVAKVILGWLVFRDVFGGGGVRDMRSARAERFKVQPIYSWASSVTAQALGRLSPLWGGRGLSTSGGVGFRSGPGTRTHLWELAMTNIGLGVTGGHPSGSLSFLATMNNRVSPYEQLYAEEIAVAVQRAGITEADLPEIMRKLSARLEGQATELGKDIRLCWDLQNNRPQPEYVELAQSVQQELAAEIGLVSDPAGD